jgi:hypothetical protein
MGGDHEPAADDDRPTDRRNGWGGDLDASRSDQDRQPARRQAPLLRAETHRARFVRRFYRFDDAAADLATPGIADRRLPAGADRRRAANGAARLESSTAGHSNPCLFSPACAACRICVLTDHQSYLTATQGRTQPGNQWATGETYGRARVRPAQRPRCGIVARLLGPVGAALFGGLGSLFVTGAWA